MVDKIKYQDDIFIARWISGSLTEEEIVEFEQWLQSNPDEKKYFDEIINIWKGYESIRLKGGLSKEERWHRISEQLYLQPDTKIKVLSKSSFWKISSVAAAAVVIFGFFYWWTALRIVTISAPRGSHVVANLPDNSLVTLNVEATIQYNKRTWRERRVVRLTGEAFFEVTTIGTPFLVKSEFVTTEVLGTRFNIKARGGKVEVACIQGKVRVKSNQIQHEPVVLLPGLASIVEPEGVPSEPFEFDINQKIGWTKGELYFQSTSLDQVFAEIARQFDVNIIIEANIENLSFTGRLALSEINEVLEVVCLSSGLNYRAVNETTYVISQ